MASRRPEPLRWALLGAGSGLGSLLLMSGCAGGCTACFGCVGSGVVLAAAALLSKNRPAAPKGAADGMAARID